MVSSSSGSAPLATVDVRTLDTLRWGPIRQMFPGFVEEIELARYLKRLLASSRCRTVEIQPHLDPDGRPSRHIIDVVVRDR